MTEKDYSQRYHHYSQHSPPPPPHSSPPSFANGMDHQEGTIVKTQAVFVNKLYKMLEDTSIQHLISWSESGDLFSVSNPNSFSKIVLPQYFKHNNWQSFVRQLNMYGFHKVNDMIHSNLTSDNQTWEFKHPHFKRGEIDDLQHIKRKSTKPNFINNNHIMKTSASAPPLSRTSSGNKDVYEKHISYIEDRLHHVLNSCELLRNESNSLRGLLSQQQKVIHEFVMLFTDLIKEDAIDVNQSRKDSIIIKLTKLLSYHHNQQQYYHTSSEPPYEYPVRPSPATSSTTSSPTNIPKNKQLGFGKESHLLNPEPMNHNDTFSDYNKKRRIQ